MRDVIYKRPLRDCLHRPSGLPATLACLGFFRPHSSSSSYLCTAATPSGVNFTKILWAAFSYETEKSSFYWNCSLGLNVFGARKSAGKLLVKSWWNWLQASRDRWPRPLNLRDRHSILSHPYKWEASKIC